MKNKLLLLLSFFLFTQSYSQELIGDKNFQMGFGVLDANAVVTDTIYASMGNNPAWNLAEWYSTSTVADLTPNVLPSGFYQWADSNKDFRFGPEGAEDYDLYFAVNSDNEYNGVYRQDGEQWPHLLVEQRFSEPFSYSNHGPACPSLDSLVSLDFSVDAKLLYNQTIVESGYNSSLHAAEFLIYFTVQNLNTSSAGYGKYVWLGIPMYDDRYSAIQGGGVQYDAGTQTLINTIPYDSCAAETMHNGNWVHFSVDILPYALEALQAAWDNNYLTESYELSDYKLGGMNMGWELPGRNICTMVTNNMSLFANRPYYLAETDTVCFNDSYTFPDNTTENNITSQITHVSNLHTITGLDSIITTTINVNTIDVSVTIYNETITANASGLNYKWLDCDNNYSVINGETNQSFSATESGNYAVEITDGICVDTSDCSNIIISNINNVSIDNISVYPNPANTVLNIDGNNINKIEIVTINGVVVESIQVKNEATKINLSNINKGIYFVRIYSDDFMKIEKVVFQ